MAGAAAADGVTGRDWLRRYLRVLGVEQRAPSLAALTELTRAQVLRAPFDNTTAIRRRRAHMGRPAPPVDTDALLESWEQGSGGVCFDVAAMLHRLLLALGYKAHIVVAGASMPGGHLAVLVEVEGGRYLVDAGNGAPFFVPIPLDGASEAHAAGLSYRFRPGETPRLWLQDRWINEAWAPFFTYDLGPTDEALREQAYQTHHTPGATWVVGGLTVMRCEDDALFVLRNDEFTRYTPAGKSSQKVAGAAEYARLATEFLRVPPQRIAESLAALRELGVPCEWLAPAG